MNLNLLEYALEMGDGWGYAFIGCHLNEKNNKVS